MATQEKKSEKAEAKPAPSLKLTIKQVAEYAASNGSSEQVAPEDGLPFLHNGQVHVTAKHLTESLDDATKPAVTAELRRLGFELIQFPYTKRDGGKSAPAYWRHEVKGQQAKGIAERQGVRASQNGGDSSDPQEGGEKS